MKKFSLRLIMIIAVSFIMQSCVKDHLQSTYTYFLPVYKTKTEVWQSIKSAPPVALQKTGKLFLYGRYIFINEINKGIHIIDNADRRAPKNISFINIPGNLDIAVKNNMLYADLYTDMLTIDIADPANIVLKKVSSQVFPERDYENGFLPDSTRYIVDWIKQETTDKTELNNNKLLVQPGTWFTAAQNNDTKASAVAGISGSMARFTIVHNYLYTVGRSFLTAFNISSPADPKIENTQSLGWNIETIYPLKDKLFVGSQTGMFIYSITDPAAPSLIGNFSHACFNDPVIADDQYAYITLRTTGMSTCWNGTAGQRDELDIVNISNISQPSLVKVYDMTEPKGLSKDGDYLFICDGKAGLKIYNAANVEDIKELKIIDHINPFDVICQAGLAIVVANDGIYQYDYTNINEIKLVSKIATGK